MVLNVNKGSSNNSISSWSYSETYFINFINFEQSKNESSLRLEQNPINFFNDR